jgi:hypothetical protein
LLPTYDISIEFLDLFAILFRSYSLSVSVVYTL